MKTRILLILSALFIMTACSSDEPKPAEHFYTPYGVDYFINNSWQHVYDTEIDITDQPNEFTLEFRTFGVHEIAPIGNDGITITTLDQIGENGVQPVEFSERWNSNLYLQKFRFSTNGEKEIRVKFLYKYCTDVSECTCTLVRKK